MDQGLMYPHKVAFEINRLPQQPGLVWVRPHLGSFPRFSVGTPLWPLQRPRFLIGTEFHDAGASALACLCVPARRQAPTLERLWKNRPPGSGGV